MTDDRVQLATEIPAEAKELLKEQDGYMWENLTEAIFNTFGGERLTSPAALDREIEIMERKARNAVEEKNDAVEREQRYKQRAESLRLKRSDVMADQESETDALDALPDDMVKHGFRIFRGHGRLNELANQWFGGDLDKALSGLKERSNDRGLPLTDERFEKGYDNDDFDVSDLRSSGDSDE